MAQRMENKRIYDFEVYAPAVLGTAFKRVEILGYFPYETAVVLQGEIAPLHAEVYSTGKLPIGTPNDPRQYMYYRLKKPDGSITMLGEPWINASTIQEVLVKTCHVVIPDASTGDLARIQDMLKQAGYRDFSISFE